MKNKFLLFSSLFFAHSLLSGCAATQVALSKKDLDVQTKMSATLFLDPTEEVEEKTFFLQVKNTSDQKIDLTQELHQAMIARGLKPVASAKLAHYILQVNVLQVGKMDPSAAEASLYAGYGVDGALLGMGAAHVANVTDSRGLVAAGIFGAVISVAADSLVKDVHYSLITDLQIQERLPKGVKAEQTIQHHNQSGTSGGTTSRVSGSSDRKLYQTRILSSANQVNLEFAKASPELQKSLVRSIAGIF